MRKMIKLEEPKELKEMKDYWIKKVREVGSDYYKNKYRAKPIKETLKIETSNKCVYCESKIGHNTPGDVEHKVPVSVQEEGRFKWENLTVGCTECNRRKNDYYDQNCMFIDPYTDNVENMMIHAGPAVFHKPGDETAEISIRVLELSEVEKRPELFAQKVAKLKAAMDLIDRIVRTNTPPLKKLLIKELHSMAEPQAEFSSMVKAIICATQVE